jgi:hypothetical protein
MIKPANASVHWLQWSAAELQPMCNRLFGAAVHLNPWRSMAAATFPSQPANKSLYFHVIEFPIYQCFEFSACWLK